MNNDTPRSEIELVPTVRRHIRAKSARRAAARIVRGGALPFLLWLLLCITSTMYSQDVKQMLGGKHDLSSGGSHGNTCAYCHILQGRGEPAPTPVWRGAKGLMAREYSAMMADSTQAKDQMYSQRNITCLACHDGSNRFFVRSTVGRIVTGTRKNYKVFNTLAEDRHDRSMHPVDIDYAAAAAASAGTLLAPNNIRFGLPLYDGRVQCATCHDPHGNPDSAATDVLSRLVRNPGGGGGVICVGCHVM
jgi:hypothetical protein